MIHSVNMDLYIMKVLYKKSIMHFESHLPIL